MKRRTFTPEEVDVGLTALVLLGNAEGASRHLKEEGLNVNARTLRDWSTRHADRLAELQNGLAGEVAQRVAGRAEAIALRALDTQERLLDRFDGQLGELKPADTASAVRNLAVSASLGFDRLSGPIRGRPNLIVVRVDANERLDEFARQLGILDSTAVEEPVVGRLDPGDSD